MYNGLGFVLGERPGDCVVYELFEWIFMHFANRYRKLCIFAYFAL